MITHRLPVMATFGARTRLNPLSDLLLEYVASISRLTGLRIDPRKHILKYGFPMAHELAGPAVELPQDARLADRKHQLLLADIYQDPLEHLIEIQRFSGDMLEVPLQFAVIGVQRQSGIRIETFVASFRPATYPHPGLGLGHAPIRFVQVRIVAAGDPGLTSGAHHVRDLSPCITAWLPVARRRMELPNLLSARGLVGADK